VSLGRSPEFPAVTAACKLGRPRLPMCRAAVPLVAYYPSVTEIGRKATDICQQLMLT
jgi:hypothetical protein